MIQLKNILKKPFLVSLIMLGVIIVIGLIIGLISLLLNIDVPSSISAIASLLIAYMTGQVYSHYNEELTKNIKIKISFYYALMQVILGIMYIILFYLPLLDSYLILFLIIIIIVAAALFGLVYVFLGLGYKFYFKTKLRNKQKIQS